jgi:hypothetical protein
MTCPLCGTRKARRACPALGHDICALCCGTKRLTQIACPPHCAWLASSKAHPPANVLRQRDRDLRFIAPMLQELPERAGTIFLLVQNVVIRYARTAIPPLRDGDVAEATATLASTFETAARGIIYEHQATSLPAQRLMAELRTAIEDVTRQAGAGRESAVMRDASAALRRIEWGAREAPTRLGPGDRPFLDLLARSFQDVAAPLHDRETAANGDAPSNEPPRIIIP